MRKKAKKGRGKAGRVKKGPKGQKVPNGVVLGVRVDDLFKGRGKGDFTIAEDSWDDQAQGFLAEFHERAPAYFESGVFVCQGRDGRWKVNVFGVKDFNEVMGNAIRVALLAFAQGPSK